MSLNSEKSGNDRVYRIVGKASRSKGKGKGTRARKKA
jgi:hypothetical protein